MRPPEGDGYSSALRTVDLKITDIAFGGKGVARKNGKAVFIPFTIEGELVSAKIRREKKQFAEAEVVDLRQRSPYRVDPPCPYFGRCGGCAYQHIDYAHQLEIKTRQVRDVLKRIGKLDDVPMRPIIDGHYTLRARSGPRVFSQTNDGVANALRDLIVQLMPSNQELLVDAFCGAGFFAKALIGKFQRIVGIDWDRFAIAAAKEDATEKETYIAGDIEEELVGAVHRTARGRLGSIAPTLNPDKTALLVDPPAVGLSARLRKTIVDLAPATLIYVSCNPATLARDLAELRSRFKIESVTPLDMFPQTAEIEVVAQLQRSNASTN
ncbi:MAG: hypothetical protein DMF18_09260 [Verrucomicrobia bacterium]|nr:MAG: hypothetical protein DMF18_09260 [Verrucomicrobiota bacterium]